jgi:hypothetical protein
MNEDSFLDSFMESYIGGWTGDEDRMCDSEEYWEEEDREYDRRCRELDGEFDHDDY